MKLFFMIMKYISIILVFFGCMVSSIAKSQQVNYTEPKTGIKSWSINTSGVHFSLTQILPEQAQAFYVNRGFALEQTSEYASSCVYMTVLRNDNAPAAIHYVSNDWGIVKDGRSHRMLSVNSWLQKLKEIGVNKSALVAFQWAQFPPENEYEPGGDWNQGMLSIGLPASTKFNINARWKMNGEMFSATLNGVQCAN